MATSPAVKNLIAWPLRRGNVRLSWTLVSGEWITLRIQRDPGDGVFVTIGKVTGAEQFLDTRAPTTTLNRAVRYQLVPDGLEDVYGPVGLGVCVSDPVAERIRDDHELLLQGWGIPVSWFSVKAIPLNCSCYDPLLQQSTRSECPECRGTGGKTGYADPVLDYVFQVSGQNKQNQIRETGETQQTYQAFWSSGDIIAKPNDVFVMPTGERYRAVQVIQDRLRGFPTKQSMQCVTINPSDAEFDFQIPDPLLDIMRNPPRRTALYLA
jgi:hypothetical protein